MSIRQDKLQDERAPRLDGLIPVSGNHYQYGDLSVIERMLLVTDGTFTHLLEAFVGSRVEVDVLKTVPVKASPDVQLLFAREKLAEVWYREALLVDAEGRSPFVFAQSYLDPQAFDKETQEDILNSPDGLGRIFNKLRQRSERELLGFVIETDGAHLHYFDCGGYRETLSRTYRVLIEGVCVAVITEKMPRGLFSDAH